MASLRYILGTELKSVINSKLSFGLGYKLDDTLGIFLESIINFLIHQLY